MNLCAVFLPCSENDASMENQLPPFLSGSKMWDKKKSNVCFWYLKGWNLCYWFSTELFRKELLGKRSN